MNFSLLKQRPLWWIQIRYQWRYCPTQRQSSKFT